MSEDCNHTFHRLGGIDDCPVCNPQPPAPECPRCKKHQCLCSGDVVEPAQDGAREWFLFIVKDHEGYPHLEAFSHHKSREGDSIHVIEKSAYLQVKAERDELRDEYLHQCRRRNELADEVNRMHDDWLKLEKERDKLTARIAELEAHVELQGEARMECQRVYNKLTTENDALRKELADCREASQIKEEQAFKFKQERDEARAEVERLKVESAENEKLDFKFCEEMRQNAIKSREWAEKAEALVKVKNDGFRDILRMIQPHLPRDSKEYAEIERILASTPEKR